MCRMIFFKKNYLGMKTKKHIILAISVVILSIMVGGYFYVQNIKTAMSDKVAAAVYKIAGFDNKESFKNTFRYKPSINFSLQPILMNVTFPIKFKESNKIIPIKIKSITLKNSKMTKFGLSIKGIYVDREPLRDMLPGHLKTTLDIVMNMNPKIKDSKLDIELDFNCTDANCKSEMEFKVVGMGTTIVKMDIAKAGLFISQLESHTLYKSLKGLGTKEKAKTKHAILRYVNSSSSKSIKESKDHFKSDPYALALIGIYESMFVIGRTSFSIKSEDEGLKKAFFTSLRQSQNIPSKFTRIINKLEKADLSMAINGYHDVNTLSISVEMSNPLFTTTMSVNLKTKDNLSLLNKLTKKRQSKNNKIISILPLIEDFTIRIKLAENEFLSQLNEEMLRDVVYKYASAHLAMDDRAMDIILREAKNLTLKQLMLKISLKKNRIKADLSIKTPLADLEVKNTIEINNGVLKEGYNPLASAELKEVEISLRDKGLKGLLSSLVYTQANDSIQANDLANAKINKELKRIEILLDEDNPGIDADIISAILTITNTESTPDLITKLESYATNPGLLKIKFKASTRTPVPIADFANRRFGELFSEIAEDGLTVYLEENK